MLSTYKEVFEFLTKFAFINIEIAYLEIYLPDYKISRNTTAELSSINYDKSQGKNVKNEFLYYSKNKLIILGIVKKIIYHPSHHTLTGFA